MGEGFSRGPATSDLDGSMDGAATRLGVLILTHPNLPIFSFVENIENKFFISTSNKVK